MAQCFKEDYKMVENVSAKLSYLSAEMGKIKNEYQIISNLFDTTISKIEDDFIEGKMYAWWFLVGKRVFNIEGDMFATETSKSLADWYNPFRFVQHRIPSKQNALESLHSRIPDNVGPMVCWWNQVGKHRFTWRTPIRIPTPFLIHF
jgi:hypothetical protein